MIFILFKRKLLRGGRAGKRAWASLESVASRKRSSSLVRDRQTVGQTWFSRSRPRLVPFSAYILSLQHSQNKKKKRDI
jgi:hypothetical protein